MWFTCVYSCYTEMMATILITHVLWEYWCGTCYSALAYWCKPTISIIVIGYPSALEKTDHFSSTHVRKDTSFANCVSKARRTFVLFLYIFGRFFHLQFYARECLIRILNFNFWHLIHLVIWPRSTLWRPCGRSVLQIQSGGLYMLLPPFYSVFPYPCRWLPSE